MLVVWKFRSVFLFIIRVSELVSVLVWFLCISGFRT